MKARTMIALGLAAFVAVVAWVRWDTRSESLVAAIDYTKGTGIETPCEVVRIGWYMDGGTIGGMIKDATGREVPFCLDGGTRLQEYADKPRLAYLGAEYPTREGAFPVPLCSEGELELIHLLSDWIDTEIPQEDQDWVFAAYFDDSVPIEERIPRLPGLTGSQKRALMTERVVVYLKAQRVEFGCPSAGGGAE